MQKFAPTYPNAIYKQFVEINGKYFETCHLMTLFLAISKHSCLKTRYKITELKRFSFF